MSSGRPPPAPGRPPPAPRPACGSSRSARRCGPVAARGRCSVMSDHERGAHGAVAWAMSPTTVIEPDSERRVSIRSCMGERSCTSSTTMWPYLRTPRRRRRGAGRADGGPRRPGRRRPASRPPRRTTPTAGGRGAPAPRATGCRAPAAAISGGAPNRSWSSSWGERRGHIRSRASASSGTRRTLREKSSKSNSSSVSSEGSS